MIYNVLISEKLITSLHSFYLNRLLRMFPLLAALVLLEASLFHHVSDGPYWNSVATNVQRCRSYWWATLLHIQNYVVPRDMVSMISFMNINTLFCIESYYTVAY